MIPYEERKAVYEEAVVEFGVDCQLWKAVEEMSELTKEICKINVVGWPNTACANLVDEIADVTIMVEQLRLIFNVNTEVQDRIDYKVRRLAQRIKKEG